MENFTPGKSARSVARTSLAVAAAVKRVLSLGRLGIDISLPFLRGRLVLHAARPDSIGQLHARARRCSAIRDDAVRRHGVGPFGACTVDSEANVAGARVPLLGAEAPTVGAADDHRPLRICRVTGAADDPVVGAHGVSPSWASSASAAMTFDASCCLSIACCASQTCGVLPLLQGSPPAGLAWCAAPRTAKSTTTTTAMITGVIRWPRVGLARISAPPFCWV